eukprot:122382-Chlamydomonas_euryale.AAC.1
MEPRTHEKLARLASCSRITCPLPCTLALSAAVSTASEPKTSTTGRLGTRCPARAQRCVRRASEHAAAHQERRVHVAQ